ncbi:MAG TPA: amidohydrolase [Acidimicrobiales bacterium]|nr:amidohydrolase [Acidimicrobiales bacterium]
MTGASAPPRLYRRAHLRTPDRLPGADALATAGDRIVAVGTEEQCRAALPADAEVVDLGGAVLAPGFVDAHLHPMVMCVFEQQLVLDGARSVAEVLDAVADRARTLGAGDAVIGFQLDDELLAERRMPSAAELERASGGRPVVLLRRDGHHAVASTSALAAVGFDRPGNVPAGGQVDLDARGAPTGLARENAVAPLMGLMPEVSFDDLEAGLASWTDRLLSQGVTAISAMCQTTPEGPGGSAAELEAVGWSVLVDRVPFDVQTILIAPDLAAVHDARTGPLHRPDDGRRIDAVKLFLDGTLGGRTACMHQPFSDHPTARGIATLSPEDAHRRAAEAHAAGFQLCLHAIGDEATRDAAELLARVLADEPGPHRHRVEHASVLDDATVDRFAELGITAVVQPINLRSEHHWLSRRLGTERVARTYPFRRLLDAGVGVAGSSDAPIEATDVLAAMDAAVDRGDLAPEQAITPDEALGLYTTGASAARQTEDRLGRLAVGRRADLVVLDALPAATVLATVIGGTERYRHPDRPLLDPA